MSTIIRPSTPDDQPAIARLLSKVHDLPADSPLLSASGMRWRYWSERTDASEPRSLVADRAGEVVGHIAMWPLKLVTPSGVYRCMNPFDWAAAASAPGAGTSVMLRALRSVDFAFTVGGTARAKQIFGKLGLNQVSIATTLARPLRPLRQVRRHQSQDLRLPLRFVRNAWWSQVPRRSAPSGWTFERAVRLDDVDPAMADRDPGFLRFLADHPPVPITGFHLCHNGVREGFFVLAEVDDQARIGGMWMTRPEVDRWRIGYELAQAAALETTAASEVVARAADPGMVAGAAAAGLRPRLETPVFFHGPAGHERLLPACQLWDRDVLVLTDEWRFLT